MYLLAGVVVGYTLISFHWILAALIVFGPITAVVLWYKPEYGLYLFFTLVILLTDSAPRGGQEIFAVQDLDVVKGIPPPIVSFLLVMCLFYFFKLYLVEHKNSLVTIRPGLVLIVILLIATGTGLWRGWNSTDVRVDAMDVVFPVLCFYLCANVLDTQQKIYTMLAVIFLVGVIDASIFDVYYLSGHGWPYIDEGAGIGRIVTQDATDLMIFVVMTVTVYAASMNRILTGWHRVIALVASLPMLFAFIFSFRRGFWVGMIATLIIYYTLGSQFDKRRTLMGVWAVLLILTTALLLTTNHIINSEIARPFVQRLLSITNPKQDSNEHHRLEREKVFKELLASPILGFGLGSVHEPVYGLSHWWAPEKQPLRVVHNTYLLVWMKLGLPGFLFFLWMLGRYALVLINHCTRAMSSESRPIIAGTGSLLGLWLVLMLIGPVMPYWYQTFTIALFAAMTLSLIRDEQREKRRGAQWLAYHEYASERQVA